MYADASYSSRIYADLAYAASGMGPTGPVPGAGQFAQAGYAFRAYADATFAGSGGTLVTPPPPPPATGGGGNPRVGQAHGVVLRHFAEPLSKRQAKKVRRDLKKALPHRSTKELSALYARLVGDDLPLEETAPVAKIVRPFSAPSDVAPAALPPAPAVDFAAIARQDETQRALASALDNLVAFARARDEATRKAAHAAAIEARRAAAELAADIEDEEAIANWLINEDF